MYSSDMVNKVLRYAVLGGIFLIPALIPFVIAKTMFFPFITGKNIAFRIIVELLLGGWLILMWRDIEYRLRFSWILGALTVFLGVVTLADILGEDPLRSFWSNYERMDGLITLLHLFAYFVVAGSMFRDSKILWKRFLQTSLGASVLISIYSIFQLLGYVVINQGGVRIDATFGNATYLASYILFHIFFAAFLFVWDRGNSFLRWTYDVVMVLHIFILLNTATRGANLALVGGILLTALLILFFGRTAPVVKKGVVASLIALVVLVGGFVAARNTDFIRHNPVIGRLANISLKEGESRFLVWNMAWQGVKEHPVLGWGQDNFMLPFSKYYDPRMYGQEPWFDRAHNIIFDWLIAGGIPALLSYLSIFAALLYAIWIYPRRRLMEREDVQSAGGFSPVEKSILTGLLAAYFFQNLFVFDNVMSYALFFSVLAFMHGQSLEKGGEVADRAKTNALRSNELMRRLIAPVVIVSVLFLLYFLNVKTIVAGRALLRGIDLRTVQGAMTLEARRNAFDEKLGDFKKALGNYLGRTEAREQIAQIAVTIASAPIEEDIKQRFFTLARSEMAEQIKEVPGNVRYHLFLASLFTAYKMPEETIASLEKALSISPKKQTIYYILGNAYLDRGDMAKALLVLREAFELEPKNDQARNIYIAILIRAGEKARAEELLVERYGAVDISRTSQDIINAYMSVGNFKTVIPLLQKKIEEDPSDLQAHISLSAAFLGLGDRAKAVEQLELTISRFPDFKDQGDFYIREIKAGRNP